MNLFKKYYLKIFWFQWTAESQKGVNVIWRCSCENQKGVIAIDIVQR